MKILSILISLFTLIISCQKEARLVQPKNSISFSDNDFKIIKHLKSFELHEVSDSLLFPTTLTVNKGYLFINEFKSNKFVHIVKRPKDSYIGKFGNIGRGPGEILIPKAFSISEGGFLRVFDPKQKKIVEFETSSLLNKKGFKNEYNLKNNTQINSVSIYKNKMFFLDQNNVKNRLFEQGLDGSNLIGYGELPKKEESISDLQHGEVCLANMSNNKNLFAICYNYNPLLEIFDLKQNKWITIIGPENNRPAYKSFRSKTYYNSVKITDKYIYALYNGKEANKGFDSEHTDIIYVFDYNGKIIKKLILDKGIFVFDIYNDKIIYGIHYTKGLLPKILKFEI